MAIEDLRVARYAEAIAAVAESPDSDWVDAARAVVAVADAELAEVRAALVRVGHAEKRMRDAGRWGFRDAETWLAAANEVRDAIEGRVDAQD